MGIVKSRSAAARKFVANVASYLGTKGAVAHGFQFSLDGWRDVKDHSVQSLADLASRQVGVIKVTDLENKKIVLGDGVHGGTPFGELSPEQASTLIAGNFPTEEPEVKEEEEVTFKDENGKNRLGKRKTGAPVGANGVSVS